MLIDIVLAVSTAIFAYNLVKNKQRKRVAALLNSQNDYLADSMLLLSSSDDKQEYIQHKWSIPDTEVLLVEFLSGRTVVLRTKSCNRCGILKREIIKGFDIARKRSLHLVEGYYVSGCKVHDPGCKEIA